jgi:hypothetical protein
MVRLRHRLLARRRLAVSARVVPRGTPPLAFCGYQGVPDGVPSEAVARPVARERGARSSGRLGLGGPRCRSEGGTPVAHHLPPTRCHQLRRPPERPLEPGPRPGGDAIPGCRPVPYTHPGVAFHVERLGQSRCDRSTWNATRVRAATPRPSCSSPARRRRPTGVEGSAVAAGPLALGARSRHRPQPQCVGILSPAAGARSPAARTVQSIVSVGRAARPPDGAHAPARPMNRRPAIHISPASVVSRLVRSSRIVFSPKLPGRVTVRIGLVPRPACR